jgi:hypothetical protein
MSRVALTILIVVPYANFMHHTTKVLTPLILRTHQFSTKLTYLLLWTNASTWYTPYIGFCFIIFTLCE